MAQWIAIAFTAFTLLLSIWKLSTDAAADKARIGERIDFMKGELISLQSNTQSPEERDALAQVVHSELDAHAKEDFLKFKALDDRMVLMAGNVDRKLDLIIRKLEEMRK